MTHEPAMRRDRDGDMIPDLPPQPEHQCRRGWLGHDNEGRPIPCLTCKPHLIRTRPNYTDPLEDWTP